MLRTVALSSVVDVPFIAFSSAGHAMRLAREEWRLGRENVGADLNIEAFEYDASGIR